MIAAIGINQSELNMSNSQITIFVIISFVAGIVVIIAVDPNVCF